MNPAFRFDIVGQDKATVAINRINAKLTALSRPSREFTAALSALSRNTGVDMVAKGFGRLATNAALAARRVASMVPAIGAIAGAGSIAGVAALAAHLGRTAIQSDNLAAKLGMGARQLQVFQVAARLVGVSADESAGSLDSLANTLEHARWDPTTAAYLRQLNIEVRRLPNGSVDAVDALRQIADVVAKLPNAQAQRTVADAFGIAGMLPLLRRGSAGIDELQKRANGFAAVLDGPAMAAGKAYNEQLVRFEEATERLKRSLGIALLPAVNDTVAAITRLTDRYGGVVASKIGETVRDIAEWIRKTDWTAVGETFAKIASAVSDAAPKVKDIMQAAVVAKRLLTGEDEAGNAAPKFDLRAPSESLRRMGQFYSGEAVDAPTVPPKPARAPFNPNDPIGSVGRLIWNGGPGAAVGAGDHLAKLEQQYGLPAGLLDAMWERESSRGRNMVSPAGALGHFGFMPGTAREMGLDDPNDFGKSSKAAAEYMARLMKMNGRDLPRALAGYNWGQGNVDRLGMGRMPEETRKYIAAIQGRLGGAGGTAQASAAPAATNGTVDVKIQLEGAPPGTRTSVSSTGAAKASVARTGATGLGNSAL